MLKKVAISVLIYVAIIHSRPVNGYTRLQASTNFACMGENVTFSCTTSNSVLIWEVTFTDRTIRPLTHLFLVSDIPGILFSKSTHGMHLYFRMISNKNGILDSVLVVYTSAASLENAVIECEGSATHSLIFRFASAPTTSTGVLISEKVYNSSEFASVTLSWNDPVGRVDNYHIRVSAGLSLSQQYYSAVIPGLKLDQIPYNENVTVGISAVNCIDESEEVNISFVIGACNSLSLPLGGLVYNSSGSFNGIVPSGEQMWFGCEQGFYPSEPMISTCQEDGLWHPDPCEAVCEKECLVPVNLTNMELSLMNGDSSTSLRIFFHCKDGFFPKDEQTAVCSGNGTWFPDLTQFECHRRMAPTLTNTNNSVDNSCTNCLVYIITGSVAGIVTLLVVCTLLFAVMICIIIHSKKSDDSCHDHDRPVPVYEYITGPVYEYLNPTVTSVMTENEAYNTHC